MTAPDELDDDLAELLLPTITVGRADQFRRRSDQQTDHEIIWRDRNDRAVHQDRPAAELAVQM